MCMVLCLNKHIFNLGPLRCTHSKCKTGQVVHLPAGPQEHLRKKTFPSQMLYFEWVCDPLRTHFWYCSWEIWADPLEHGNLLYTWVNGVTSKGEETRLDVTVIHGTGRKFPVRANQYGNFLPLVETVDIWLLFGRQGREWKITQRASEKTK